VRRPGPSVLRPWPRLSVPGEDPKSLVVGSQTLAVTDRRRLDIPGGYPVRFDYRRGEGKKGSSFRTKPPLLHTRCSPQIRGKNCSISWPYIPCRPEPMGGAYPRSNQSAVATLLASSATQACGRYGTGMT